MNDRLASISETVIERLPECLARENTVIPVAANDQCITMAASVPDAQDFAALSFAAGLQEKLEFILQCKVKLEYHARSDIKAAIDKYYTYAAEIMNCDSSVNSRCPRIWSRLQPTDCQDIRYCERCSTRVHYCPTDDSALRHAAVGHRVATCNGPMEFSISNASR